MTEDAMIEAAIREGAVLRSAVRFASFRVFRKRRHWEERAACRLVEGGYVWVGGWERWQCNWMAPDEITSFVPLASPEVAA